MHILMICGSPRPRGVTAQLADRFAAAFPVDAVTRIDAYALKAAPCLGCGGCDADGVCVQRDLDGVFAQMEAADAICLAIPVYNLAPPAPFKALLDRMQRYYTVRPALPERPLVLLTAAGQPGGDAADLLERQILPNFGLIGCRLLAHFHVDGTDDRTDLTPFLTGAAAIGAWLRDLP